MITAFICSMRIRHANKLFKLWWVMSAAFPSAPLSRFVGKHSFLCQTLALEIKAALLEIFHFLFCMLCGLW